MIRMASLVIALSWVGCGEEGPWVGTYDVSGTWKLNGPFAGNRTVGDAMSELLVDEVARALPAPSFIESKVHDWLESSVGAKIKLAVDSSMPADLAPNGKLTLLLGQTLASVDLESTLDLEGERGGEFEGAETITGVSYVINGQTRKVSLSELGQDAKASIVAAWSGNESADGTLTVNPHSVSIRYGALVRLVASDLLQASELSALDAKVKSALGCKSIVAAVLSGGAGLKISVLSWDHTISAAELEQVCDSAMSSVADRAFGRFELDSRVEVGGTVSWSRVPETASITLQSGADFGGVVNIAPRAIAPKLSVSFSAARVEDH